MLVNSGPGAVPRTASQDTTAATGSVSAVGDADDLPAAVGVGLGPAHGQQQSGRLGRDVGDGEASQFGAPHCRGEAEEDQRGVAGTVRGAAVDAGDDPADLGDA